LTAKANQNNIEDTLMYNALEVREMANLASGDKTIL